MLNVPITKKCHVFPYPGFLPQLLKVGIEPGVNLWTTAWISTLVAILLVIVGGSDDGRGDDGHDRQAPAEPHGGLSLVGDVVAVAAAAAAVRHGQAAAGILRQIRNLML